MLCPCHLSGRQDQRPLVRFMHKENREMAPRFSLAQGHIDILTRTVTFFNKLESWLPQENFSHFSRLYSMFLVEFVDDFLEPDKAHNVHVDFLNGLTLMRA